MRHFHNSIRGMSLIELLVVIVVIGILTEVAMKTMTTSVEDLKRTRTQREMEDLANAIVGNPSKTADRTRSSFGYVGDVGAFPPNLGALATNPGGYATWNGPYLSPGIAQDTSGFKFDDWGNPYSYSGGLTITSTGNGTPIVKKLADANSDYLVNQFVGIVKDKNDSLPGAIKKDSVAVKVTIPNGSGGTVTKSYKPNASGLFTLDSIPAGRRSLLVIYTPQNDTLNRMITVLPRQNNLHPPIYKFSAGYFSGGGGGCGTNALTLRPNGPGSSTFLTSSGCAGNWQCVSEATPDEDASIVICASNSNEDDYYAMADPTPQACAPTKVTVNYRARLTKNQGSAASLLYVGGQVFAGATVSPTNSYANYSDSWTTNPRTGIAWTWADITNLQAGIRMSGQNGNWPAYCTQLWIVVTY
jgi:prepilin-type N-terminal cleavage/methylation domain-containing protein